MKKYVPEIGQAMFGQPYNSYECPEWVEAYLWHINTELERVMWNRNQETYESPVYNTGAKFKNKTFEMEAYSWDETKPQKYNFKWKDVEISWYKHLGRGTTINKEISHIKGEKMLNECLESIRKMDKTL